MATATQPIDRLKDANTLLADGLELVLERDVVGVKIQEVTLAGFSIGRDKGKSLAAEFKDLTDAEQAEVSADFNKKFTLLDKRAERYVERMYEGFLILADANAEMYAEGVTTEAPDGAGA